MNKNGIIVMISILLITVGVLVLALGPYERGPKYKPYWEQVNITALAVQGQNLGVVVSRGNGGWAIFGYFDNITMPQRSQLLETLRLLVAEAEQYNYTVVLIPWGADNKTNAVLSALYSGALSPTQYLNGYVNITTQIDQNRISQAQAYALELDQELGSYEAYPGIPLIPTSPPTIYAYIVRSGCSYPVYEPYQPLRDTSYMSWARWVRNALANLPTLVGQPGCVW